MTIGAVVTLKSGSPRMTVVMIDGDHVICEWFEGPALRSNEFPALAVTVEPEAQEPPTAPLDPSDETPLAETALTVRSYNALANAAFVTVGQVREASDWELLRVKHLGAVTLKDIRACFGPSRDPLSRRRSPWGDQFRVERAS